MKAYQKPSNLEALSNQNFALLKPDLTPSLAYQESARCLFCHDAPCIKACPTEIDIPLFIRQIYTQNFEGAARTIYQSNFFGNACGKVCPTEVLCEGACVYNHEQAKPIQIGQLQSYASAAILQQEKKLFSAGAPKGFRIAVVGAGPAGISCACALREMGYEVDIFESKDNPSGLVLHGCAPYKIKKEEVLGEVTWLQNQFGFNIRFGKAISSMEQWRELEQSYDAIFLGMGLGEVRAPGIPGEQLRGVWSATDFIAEVKMNPLELTIGKRVVVIGGGNTAMDAAAESLLLGAEEVSIAYRRTPSEMTAYEFEQAHVRKIGVRCIFQKVPVEILGNDAVEGLRLAKTEILDEKVIVNYDFIEYLPCDTVILATGQQQGAWRNQISGLEFHKKGEIVHNPDTLQTSNPIYFAGGDLLNGGAEVVYAVADGKKAARGIDRYLTSTSSMSASPSA
jgi:dihydropyrimidine dehydrogenase (NAD+) subunit PreT